MIELSKQTYLLTSYKTKQKYVNIFRFPMEDFPPPKLFL